MIDRKSSTHAEAALVAEALRASNGTADASQDAALAILRMSRSGETVAEPRRLARVIEKRRRIDEVRRAGRTVALTSEPIDSSPNAEEELPDRKRRVRAKVRDEAARSGWPAEWWIEIERAFEPCTTCKGRGVLRNAPEDQWIAHSVRPKLRPELRKALKLDREVDALRIPPRCTACGGTGDGRAIDDAASKLRKRERKTAMARAGKARTRVEATGQLDGDYADAMLDAARVRAVGLRRKLVETLCSPWQIAPLAEHPVSARDLALAALLAGDWPFPDTSDDWRRMTDAEIIAAERRAMQKAHADVVNGAQKATGETDVNDFVRPLTAKGRAAR